jgi:cardiolipin synthase
MGDAEKTMGPATSPAVSKEAASRTIDVDGNALTLIPDGPERFEALIALIDGAKTNLRLLYYTYRADASGEAVRDSLMRAVTRGVKVALLIDGFGSSATPDNFFTALGKAGATFCRFNPSFGRRYLLRNHQKLAMADDARVLIGGFNIGDDYFGRSADGAWRDIGLMVVGPAAVRLAPYYDALMDWTKTKGARMRDLLRLIHVHSETKGLLQWQYGAPMRRLSPWAVSTSRDLVHAKDVEMIAAYFSPTTGVLKRIARAGDRNRARVITAAKSDNSATIAAARFTYNRLLKRGVEMFEYQPTKLHSKLLVMDDVVQIGSSNFDIRSLYLNLELMLRVEDAEFAGMMRQYFEGEISDSLPITAELHAKRATLANRIKWALSFFLVTSADYTVTRRLNFGAE